MSRTTTRRWIAVPIALLLVALSLTAQRANEAMQVTIVEVPVTVVDRDGNIVRGLTADDFEVLDDGKRVPVEYFEVLNLSTISARTEPGTPLPPAATRHFLLMFDLANSSPGTIERASEAAREFVEKQIGPRDLVAVSTFTAESGARMVTNFTKDRALLSNAIRTLGNPKYFKVADPLMISATVSSTSDGTATARGREGLDTAIAEGARETERMQQAAHDSEMRNRLRIQLGNMGTVARALDGLRGQKQIILLSEGFDARLVQGREQLGSAKTREENEAVLSGEVWNVDSEQRFGSTSSSRDVSDMAALFRRSDVVLHAIDIKGLRASDPTETGVAASRSSEALHLITTQTGGSVFKNANDLAENFSTMLKRQEVVYVLGFTARGTGKPGKFHQLRVRVNNVRNARVTHRAGYYEPSGQISELERTLSLGEILMTDAPIDDVVVTIGATTLPGPGGKARVPVVVEVPGPRLLDGVTGDKINAQLYLYAFDENDRVVDFLQQGISIDLKQAGDLVRKGGIRYFGSLKLPQGPHAIKGLVRVDESGRIGFKRADLVVPAFDRAAVMPPLLFREPGNWAMLIGPARGDEYSYPFSIGEEKFIPQNRPELQPNGEYKIALFLYRMPLENLSVTPSLISRDGSSRTPNVSLLGRTSADERGSIKLVFQFRPQELSSGNHELRFDVKAADGSTSAVSMPFVIR